MSERGGMKEESKYAWIDKNTTAIIISFTILDTLIKIKSSIYRNSSYHKSKKEKEKERKKSNIGAIHE